MRIEYWLGVEPGQRCFAKIPNGKHTDHWWFGTTTTRCMSLATVVTIPVGGFISRGEWWCDQHYADRAAQPGPWALVRTETV